MKMMFDGLGRPFKLSNLRHGHEVRKILCFAKHYSCTHYYNIIIINNNKINHIIIILTVMLI
jgi:hypothetical protein